MSSQAHQDTIAQPVLKIATAWAAVGITSWQEAASFVAFIYTCVLLGEWLWKRVIRPYVESRGWVLRRPRRKDDQ